MKQKEEMLSQASEAEKKAKKYGDEAIAYRDASKRAGNSVLGSYWGSERDVNNKIANFYEEEAEILRKRATPSINSLEQYKHEREAGDPNALRLSFEEWKKL